LLCRDGRCRPKAGVCLFRGRTGPEIIRQATHKRRGATDRGEHCEAAGVIATTKRRGRKVKRPLPVSYQIYVAASAIKTATAMNNTTICTHRLLVSPPRGRVCIFIVTSSMPPLDLRQPSRFSDWPNEPAHRLCRSLIGKFLPRLWLDRPRQRPGRCIRSPGTGR
jgi:hypothetical protein